MIIKYRKRPILVEAVQLRDTEKSYNEIIEWTAESKTPAYRRISSGHNVLMINTLTGEHVVLKDDYVIKEITGEFYPCKPSIFKVIYDKEDSE